MKYRVLVWQLRLVAAGLQLLRRYAASLRQRYYRYLSDLDTVQ